MDSYRKPTSSFIDQNKDDDNEITYESSSDATNTMGSEDYIPESDDDGHGGHMRPANDEHESPNKARRQSKPKRKNVPN